MKLKPMHFYMALPVLLLGMSLTIQLTAATLASRGNDAEIERDYYDRAVNWDDYQKDVAASHALGWTLDIEPEPFRQPGLEHQVTFRITDREGLPVEGLSGKVSAFQNSIVNEMSTIVVREQGAGLYVGTYRPLRTGRWVWRFALERSGDGELVRYVGEAKHDLWTAPVEDSAP